MMRINFQDIQPMMESVLSDLDSGRNQFCSFRSGPCSRRQRTGSEFCSKSNSSWSYRLNLSCFPTKAEDIHVKCENGNLIISGTSETEQENSGFKVFSSHVWSKEIQIPEKVDVQTIKAKLGEKNILNLTAQFKNSSQQPDVEIEIEKID